MYSFITNVLPLSSSRATPSVCHRRDRRTTVPTMVSGAAVVADLAAVGGVAAAAYFFISRLKKSDTSVSNDEAGLKSALKSIPKFKPKSKPRSAVKVVSDPVPPQKFVIGLSSTTVTDLPEYSSPTKTKRRIEPIGLTIDTVGINLDDYANKPAPAPETVDPEEVRRVRQERLEEELQFATDALLDANMCGGMLVVDAEGDVIWSGGELMSDSSSKINMSFVMDHADKKVIQVTDNSRVPYFEDSVRSVIYTSLGSPRSALVLAGTNDDTFAGDREKRIMSAIATRLSPFMTFLSEVEAAEEDAVVGLA